MRTVREMSPKWKDTAKATGKLYGHPVVNGADVKPGDVILLDKNRAVTIISLGSVVRGQQTAQVIDHGSGKQGGMRYTTHEVYAKPIDLNSTGSAQDRIALAMAWSEKVTDSGLKFVSWAGLGLPTDKDMAKVFAKAKKDMADLKNAYGVESRGSRRSEMLALAEDDELGEVSDVQKILKGMGKAPGGFAGKPAGELAVGDVMLFTPSGNSRWGAIVTDIKPVGKTQVKISMLTNLGKPYEIKKDREFMMAVPTEFNVGTPEQRMKLALDWAKRLKAEPELERFLSWTWVPQSDAEADAAMEKARLEKDGSDRRDAERQAQRQAAPSTAPRVVTPVSVGRPGGPPPASVELFPKIKGPSAAEKAKQGLKEMEGLDYAIHQASMGLRTARTTLTALGKIVDGTAVRGMTQWKDLEKQLEGGLQMLEDLRTPYSDLLRGLQSLAKTEDKGFGGTRTLEAMRDLAGLTTDDLSSFAEARNAPRFRR